MEHGNDLNQSILPCRLELCYIAKRGMKSKRKDTDANPPRGDGERARKSLLKKKILFYYYWLQWHQDEISETSWSFYGMKRRSYNSIKFLNFSERGDPRGDLNATEATFEQKLLLISVTPAKKKQAC